MSNNDKLNVRLKTVITETHEVELSVNGTSKGTRKINGGPSLLAFCQEAAQEFGVNTFEITIDGSPVSAKTASKPISEAAPSGSKVGVVAQNSRGTDPRQVPAEGSDPGDEHAQAAATHEGMPEAAATEESSEEESDEEATEEATGTQG